MDWTFWGEIFLRLWSHWSLQSLGFLQEGMKPRIKNFNRSSQLNWVGFSQIKEIVYEEKSFAKDVKKDHLYDPFLADPGQRFSFPTSEKQYPLNWLNIKKSPVRKIFSSISDKRNQETNIWRNDLILGSLVTSVSWIFARSNGIQLNIVDEVFSTELRTFSSGKRGLIITKIPTQVMWRSIIGMFFV